MTGWQGRNHAHHRMRWLWVLAFARTTNIERAAEGRPRRSAALGQLPPAARPQLLVGFQAGHREQMVQDLELVALGEFGEFGRVGCDQDQGVIRAALPSHVVARRSSPAGRLALPAAPCAAQKA
jgi:hypothetical protein